MRSGTKSYMRKGFLIYEEMHKYFIPLGLASDIAKPYQIYVKQRSRADVNELPL